MKNDLLDLIGSCVFLSLNEKESLKKFYEFNPGKRDKIFDILEKSKNKVDEIGKRFVKTYNKSGKNYKKSLLEKENWLVNKRLNKIKEQEFEESFTENPESLLDDI